MATQISKRSQKKTGRLDGKITVVTGASRGVGKAIAELFAREGACSILVVRDRATGEQLADDFRQRGYKADFGVADVTVGAQVSMLALDLMQRYPGIDILVNNAGVFLDEDREMRPSSIDLLVLERTLQVNLHGPIQVCDAFIPHVRPGGRIINVSSTMGQLFGEADAYGPAYSISKTALNKYTELLAADLRDRDIMVDCFHPGWVKTDMGGAQASVEPEKAAQTALFLATRPQAAETGLFWRDSEVIPW